ncbi:MAG: DNA polymerase III subunit alpha [Desulfobacterales bacterium]|nr:DNA polymerase III subunit alpha [Desulfobacterales bacterium]
MIPLTVRSAYSLMWGVSGIKALCRHAKKMGYDRLALTDTDNLYGLWPFLTACKREGIQPIVGAEVTDRHTSARAICLVKNNQGYSHLCQLLSRRHTAANFALKAGLIKFSEGLAVLTTHPELLRASHDAGIDIAAAMPRKPLPAAHPLCKAARRLNIPVVATPGSFFSYPDDAAIHRVLRAIDNNTAISRLKNDDVAPADAFLAAPEEYQNRFATCPEAIENTAAIAGRLEFTGPDFGLVMPPYEFGSPAQADTHLREAAYKGAHRRYGGVSDVVGDRLEHELRIISEMGFSGYFLIVSDIVSHSPRTCGRGSGAASLVAYCLDITNVCPIKHDLYFERFLNPGRKDPPDIDVDFAWDERDDVISGVLSRYHGRAALVANHVCFKPRMAIRETARVFGLTEREITKSGDKSGDTLLNSNELSKVSPDLPDLTDSPEPWPEIFAIARRIIGLPRCLSAHPGGVVITPNRIDSYVPIQTTTKGVPIVQWEKDAVEDAGLVKIDLLGNRSLGVIRDAVTGLHENRIKFNEHCWTPEDDHATQAVLARGNTMGCFYIESPAMRLLQQKSRVGDFGHLVIHSSIIRPAANEVIQEYLRRLHGGAWAPIHPLMADVLSETFGLMVYQEDVSRVAVRIAGFSHAEADGLRKVMAKKDRAHHLQDYFHRFAAGARARGLDDDRIEQIWRMIMSFNGYSFCKPHSASYARVSFQAAYLKTHYPAEFMAAVISNQGGFYSTFAYVSEARRLGLAILPPDVLESRTRWTGRDGCLRVGLLAIKDLSAATRERIIKEREKGAFTHAADFFERIRPDDTEARALIHSGALDRFHPKQHRAALRWQFSAWQKRRNRQNTELALFSDPAPPAAPRLPEDDPKQRLRREYEVLGFLCDRHPITLFVDKLRTLNTVKAVYINKHLGRRIQFAGWLITGKTVVTKKGDPMKFVTFEDETGIIETTFFPKAYNRFCHILGYDRPFLLSGRVEENWGAPTLTVDAIRAVC